MDAEDVVVQLYALGHKLGFSLAHTRRSIERAKKPRVLLRRWERLAREDVRYLKKCFALSEDQLRQKAPESGLGADESSIWEGDYTKDPWRAMRDNGVLELEPVDETWLRKFGGETS